MYRNEMIKIFAYGLQNGYRGKGYLMHGNNVVVCSSCIPLVKEKNSESDKIALFIGIVGFLVLLLIIAKS
jgi:hypothetical protein